MKNPIDFTDKNVASGLDILLSDRTTGYNILWATKDYISHGCEYEPDCQITKNLLPEAHIQPRFMKAKERRTNRQRTKSEVYTPAWVVCYQNNACDDDWFGRKNVFGELVGHVWQPAAGHICFDSPAGPFSYIDSPRLEITCGEAPYLATRYDAATGERIPVKDRVGILDRKLRVASETARTEDELVALMVRAYKATYGYEYQGDSLLVARVNFLMSFVEHLRIYLQREPTHDELTAIAEVISWNIWQMDGLTGAIPGNPCHDCRFKNWQSGQIVPYKSIAANNCD